MYCVNHPDTETLVRCNRCLDPICPRCAIRTPVGLRCPRCAQVRRPPTYVLQPRHYVIAAAVALATSLVAGMLVAQLGGFFIFFLGFIAGGIIAEAVLRSIGGKRGLPVQIIVGVSIVVGAIVGPFLWRVLVVGSLAVLPTNPLFYLRALLDIRTLLYAGLAIVAAVGRLR
jgi:hypothetical protein